VGWHTPTLVSRSSFGPPAEVPGPRGTPAGRRRTHRRDPSREIRLPVADRGRRDVSGARRTAIRSNAPRGRLVSVCGFGRREAAEHAGRVRPRVAPARPRPTRPVGVSAARIDRRCVPARRFDPNERAVGSVGLPGHRPSGGRCPASVVSGGRQTTAVGGTWSSLPGRPRRNDDRRAYRGAVARVDPDRQSRTIYGPVMNDSQ